LLTREKVGGYNAIQIRKTYWEALMSF